MPARILIIEDNPANLDLMQYLLQAFGYSTISARDGEEGLSLALHEKPDLIVCDLQLPRLDGFAIARRIRGDHALLGVPLVAVTALAMVGDRDKVLASGFDGYISKPIAPETFVGQIAMYLPLSKRSTMAPAETAGPSTKTTATPAEPRARILAVDNTPVNLNLFQSTLEPSGYLVRTAGSVREAIRIALAFRPDLVLSDVHMPGGTGFDLITAFQADAALKAIPVILISATAMNESDRQRGLAMGAIRFITSPLEPQVILTEIEAFLRKGK